VSWRSADTPAVDPTVAVVVVDAVLFLEGELFLEADLDFDDLDEEEGAEDSRSFISLPFLPWRIKFLSCSSKGAIVSIICVFLLS